MESADLKGLSIGLGPDTRNQTELALYQSQLL